MIELSKRDAEILVAVIDYARTTEKIHRAIFEDLNTVGIVEAPPAPPHPEAVEQVQLLRDRLQAEITTGELIDTDSWNAGRSHPRAHQPHRDMLLREIRVPRSLASLELRLGVPRAQLEPWLLGLEEDGLAQQLQDGHGPITWEITAAGEREL